MQPGPPPAAASAPTYAQVASALSNAAGATTTIAGPITIPRTLLGTTHAQGILLDNTTTTSGTQISPDFELRGRQTTTVKGFRFSIRPSASGVTLNIDKSDGSAYVEGNAFSYATLDSSLFDERLKAANGFLAGVGSAGYVFIDGAGMKRGGSGNTLFDSVATGAPMQFSSSRSTGNTGAAFRFWATAGNLSAGYLLELGDGTSFTRRWGVSYTGRIEWSQTASVAALGQIGMDVTTGRPLAWCSSSGATAASQSVAVQAEVKFAHQAIAGNVTAAIGDVSEVDTSAARTITLPAIPSGVSERVFDVWVVDVTGGALANNITVQVSGGSGNTIRGASSVAIATNYGSLLLKHNGQTGSSGKWHVVASL